MQRQAIVALHTGTPLTAQQKTALAAATAQETQQRTEMQTQIARAHQGYWAALSQQADDFSEVNFALVRSGWFAEIAGMMIFGMGLFKTGFLSGSKSPRLYATTAALGYTISVPLVLIGVHQASLRGFSPAAALQWMYLPYGLQQIPAMIGNASLLLFLVRMGWLQWLQRALGAVGRTAFTSYIGTSLLCQFLFIWGPWHLYGTLEYYQQLYVVAGVWLVNLLASTLWLSHFAYGPLEWVWRSLTYWRAQPFRLEARETAARPLTTGA